ncbi:response regulator [Algoriphagus sp.]|uniref:response regulator n=1 Tax=Algoriphagus sp. TaxID=1872435 RepID=UPI0026266BBE|nr:response regulator [Algoriphagus sp.]
MKNIAFLFILIFVGGPSFYPAFSQENPKFHQVWMPDGMRNNRVLDLEQDPQGFLWIITEKGLNRYDGYEIKTYPHLFNFLLDGDLLLKSSLMIDSKNRIWTISGSLHPNLFDNEKNEFISIPNFNSVTSMAETQSGNILFGTLSGQLYSYDPDEKTKELILAKADQEMIGIFKNPKKTHEFFILFKSQLGKINIDTKEFKTLYTHSATDSFLFSTATLDRNGKLYIGTFENGVYTFDSSQTLKPLDSLTLKTKIYSPILDLKLKNERELWIATYGLGVFTYDLAQKKINHIPHQKTAPNSIKANDITALYHDYAGTTWLGTLGAGLNYFDPFLEKFKVISNEQAPDFIHLENIRSIYVDPQKRLWMGSAGNGLIRYDLHTKKWKTFSSTSDKSVSLKENRILSLQGIEEEIWIGYQNKGLSIFNTQKNTIRHFNETTQPTLPTNQIGRIIKDTQNRFWLCTRTEGLIQFDSKRGIVKSYKHRGNVPNPFPDNHIIDLVQLSDEEFMVATKTKGLIKLNTTTDEFHTLQDSLSAPQRMTTLYKDEHQHLWVGTSNQGIKVLDLATHTWIKKPELSELEGVQIHGITADSMGKIWVSSDQGITSIEQKSKHSISLVNYTKSEDLASPFNPGAFTSDPSLGIFFGGFDRILYFKGEELNPNRSVPKVALTKISNGKTEFSPEADNRFRPDENDLTFHFSSLIFSDPQKNHYQFRLLGYEQNWKTQQGTNAVTYTNLDPGEYEFQFKGSNYDGIWNENPVSYTFSISPDWYQTLWAKIGYLLLFAGLSILIYQYLKWRWAMSYKLEIKNHEALRLQEIDQLKSAFFSNISHELRTPLTLIMGPTERLIQECENPIQKSQLNLIQENAKKLLIVIDKILSIRKITAEKPSLKIRKSNLGLLIQSVLVNFYYLSAKKNLTIQSVIPLITEVWFDSDQMERILENLIHFVIQEAENHSIIGFEAIYKNKAVKFHICFSPKKHTDLVPPLKRKQNQLPEQEGSDPELKIKLIEKLIFSHYGSFKLSQEKSGIHGIEMEFSVDKYSFHPSEVVDEEEWEMDRINPAEARTKLSDQAPKILIVEDNKSLRNFLVKELSHSYHIIEAADGKEGIYEAYKHIPDLILSDIMMPEMDGLALCKELKTNEKTSHIPLILLTAKIEEETQLMGLELGADDYIQKPFSSRQLAVRIEKLIELRNRLRIRYSRGNFISPKEIAASSTDEKFLHKIQEMVDSDFMETDFSVDDFCRKLGMSRMQLHRKLTALTGLSTSAFIRDQRLRKAIQKLEKTDETVSEIAYSVGFSSPSYFIKCFKETYQMTPLEYQQSRAK